MVTTQDLAREIALGIINTKVEGDFNTVEPSNIHAYPLIGIAKWSGSMADSLLEKINGGDKFVDYLYNNIAENKENFYRLKTILSGDEGKRAQTEQLIEDCEMFVDTLKLIPNFNDKHCIIYAGIWCTTSHYNVSNFIRNLSININSLKELHEQFKNKYLHSFNSTKVSDADYKRRADITYEYVNNLDLGY